MAANPEATSTAKPAIAETIERRVLALVSILFLLKLFDNKLHLVVW
jgi:hypothetical protein